VSRVGTIDIGTNSVLLLVTELRVGVPCAVREVSTVTRLGQGVDRARQLAPIAVERTLACLAEYRAVLDELGVKRLRVVGTSALRDAEGAEDFLSRAEGQLGVPVEVISGDQEARLAFNGALSSLPVLGPVLVIDIGGGSTEFVFGEVGRDGPRVHSGLSLNIGSVRLTERHVHSDPPTPEELQALRANIERELRKVELPAFVGTVVGVAGTVTTLGSVIRALPRFDATALHGERILAPELRETLSRLTQLPVNFREALTGMNPGRADVIIAGAMILDAALALAEAEECVVSARGLRWGLAEELTNSA